MSASSSSTAAIQLLLDPDAAGSVSSEQLELLQQAIAAAAGQLSALLDASDRQERLSALFGGAGAEPAPEDPPGEVSAFASRLATLLSDLDGASLQLPLLLCGPEQPTLASGIALGSDADGHSALLLSQEALNAAGGERQWRRHRRCRGTGAGPARRHRPAARSEAAGRQHGIGGAAEPGRTGAGVGLRPRADQHGFQHHQQHW